MAGFHRRSATQPLIQALSPEQPAPPVTSNVEVLAGVPTLLEFVNTVPSPLTTLLVDLAPSVACLRRCFEIVSWRSSWEESWLLVAGWWAVCLFADFSFRYLAPVIVLAVLAVGRRRRPASTPRDPPPVTESSLQLTITDLSTIRTLLPVVPPPPTTPFILLLRVSALVYVPYLILTYVVPPRILLAALGTLALTHRAPWALAIRTTLQRSAFLRWTAYRLWSLLSGTPLPARLAPPSTTSAPAPVHTLRFLFTLYENQRWWMGLDWTAALLPGERPSWCAASQAPVPPPSAFALPAPAVAFTPDGHGGRLKRVALWHWDEDEWRVSVRRDGAPARVERPVPAPKDESAGSARLFKAAGKMMEASGSGAAGVPTSPTAKTAAKGAEEPEGEAEKLEERDEETDADGWVYGDNKWETRSAKGGMGKYTRYRRWSRVAVLTEIVEPVGPGPVGVLREDGELDPLPSQPAAAPAPAPTEKEEEKRTPSPTTPKKEPAPEPRTQTPVQDIPRVSSPDDSRGGGLKRRLQAAVASGTHAHS